MAEERDPPPLFVEDEKAFGDQEPEDLFASTTEMTPEDTQKAEMKEEEDDDDFFAEADTEIPLDTEENYKDEDPLVTNHTSEPLSRPQVGVIESTTVPTPTYKPSNSSTGAVSSGMESLTIEKRSHEEEEEEDGGDQFNMEISITDPKKIGDGMGAYMAYRVTTKTTLPAYRRSELSVYRRFSDFLGLHEKLVEKHQHTGLIIPHPPEKSVVGMTKIKMSKEDQGSGDFVEKRRAALERFINRTARHPALNADSLVVEFLAHDGDLPKATSTSALSGAGVMRLFSKVGDSIGKMAFKMDETDQWFEEKHSQIESLDQQLRKLHSSVEALVIHRKELAVSTSHMSKAVALLGSAEEHTALSRALSQLAEVEERLDQLHMDQADADFFVLSELIKDYIGLISAIKEVFGERVKLFRQWKEAEATLVKKRENKAKLELARKTDKISQAEHEIAEWEQKVDKCQEEFEKISKNIRKEMGRFEKQRVKDFKATVIHYLESLLNSQQQVIKHWDAFLPEAKAIA